MWRHARGQQIVEELTRVSAQEDRETLPPLSPGRGVRKLSGAREISLPGWTIKALERPGLCLPPRLCETP
jgi:hypothetical protein